jgi:predicted PurR-regulated permease PerM
MHAPRGDPPPNTGTSVVGGVLETRATDFVVRLAFLGLFAYWPLELVRPFLPVVIWAILLAVALYPAFAWLARRLGGHHGLAALIVTAIALATVLEPVSVVAASLAESVQRQAAGLQTGSLRVSSPPPYVETWPVVGEPLHEAWALASTNLDDALTRYGPALDGRNSPIPR